MTLSVGYIAAYALLVGVASFIEVPVGRGLGAFQLNVVIRAGSLAAAAVALVAVHGLSLPTGVAAVAGLGIGVITGVGSIFYCFALKYLPVSLVVTLSNLYLVITILLGIVVLGEPMTVPKVAGFGATLVGVAGLSHTPARYGVTPQVGSGTKALPIRAFVFMAAYVAVIGVGAFLEKPALKSLDPTQLNALMAVAMMAVASVALTVQGPRLPMTMRTLDGLGVGAMIGAASVFYFLGLRGLPVSVAAASSNAYVIITVLLSTVVLRQPLTRVRGGAIALTLLGVTLLALSAR
ncbi:MAG: EamA family transporter [Candidatus Dormiibacterota bacterium]